jgi:hypothetical protein
MSETNPVRVESTMPKQPPEKSKPETRPDNKKTDATVHLSQEELRKISGGTTVAPPTTPKPKGPAPAGKTG